MEQTVDIGDMEENKPQKQTLREWVACLYRRDLNGVYGQPNRAGGLGAQAESSNGASSSFDSTSQDPSHARYSREKRIKCLKGPTCIFTDADCDISLLHQSRFRDLRDILRRNLENSRQLSNYMGDITIGLWMCGVDATRAHPTLLVTCPDDKGKAVYAALNQAHVKLQYTSSESDSSKTPHFELAIYPKPIIRVSSGKKSSDQNIATDSQWHTNHHYSGTRARSLVYHSLCFTYGRSGFRTDDSSHLGQPYQRRDDADEQREANASENANMDLVVGNGSQAQWSRASSITPTGIYLTDHRVIRPPDDPEWLKTHENLEWTLVELTESDFWLPNDFKEGEEHELKGLSTIAERLPTHNREVLIITSRGIVGGQLRSIPSYIGGAHGSPLCETWTVSINNDQAIIKGDSGSLVVDTKTNEIYGQVIGVGPFDDAYLVPLATIMHQIKEVLATEDVHLDNSNVLSITDRLKEQRISNNHLSLRTDTQILIEKPGPQDDVDTESELEFTPPILTHLSKNVENSESHEIGQLESRSQPQQPPIMDAGSSNAHPSSEDKGIMHLAGDNKVEAQGTNEDYIVRTADRNNFGLRHSLTQNQHANGVAHQTDTEFYKKINTNRSQPAGGIHDVPKLRHPPDGRRQLRLIQPRCIMEQELTAMVRSHWPSAWTTANRVTRSSPRGPKYPAAIDVSDTADDFYGGASGATAPEYTHQEKGKDKYKAVEDDVIYDDGYNTPYPDAGADSEPAISLGPYYSTDTGYNYPNEQDEYGNDIAEQAGLAMDENDTYEGEFSNAPDSTTTTYDTWKTWLISHGQMQRCLEHQIHQNHQTRKVSSFHQANIFGGSAQSILAYQVVPGSNFQPGEVFKAIWATPCGVDLRPHSPEPTERRTGDDPGFYIGPRRFVVVATDEGNHSTCVPIFTYGRKGCKKEGLKPRAHSIVYSKPGKPRQLPKEPELGFKPVSVNMYAELEKLDKASRVNYSKLTDIDHNVPVMFIGHIDPKDWDIVLDAVNERWESKKKEPSSRSKHHSSRKRH
ncbi:hypothetical protein SCUP234_07285 [Seiridium cupressi]